MTILANHQNFVRAGMTWQQHMKQAIRDPESLANCLDLPLETICREQATGDFPLFVPLPYLSRIKPGKPTDPLLRQVLPVTAENASEPGYVPNPLNEDAFSLAPGLLQKYENRVLLVTTGACAIHCRYCFRRNFPYSESPTAIDAWEPSIQRIENDSEIEEVILSGGDPLTIVDSVLQQLVERVAMIPHVKRLRLHTRLPIVIPQRVTGQLLDILGGSRLLTVVVVHVNHANELDDAAQSALAALRKSCASLLNQSVFAERN